ncbi:MAG: hypothetical protein EKK51_22540 [Mycolicibacterium sp.]|uniref:hypothetical protein n=1 Tax=Mycolicibacterium sp. TaxID=2320850 RepID=UPI000FAF0E17|nr:hypothetical protein [Mycolicibacterium sp.]RUP28758.1 MAG: hypothetical protein EKK51_22540 [Mycolicibacterium sp.]
MSRKVIFPPADYWTHKEPHMPDQPAAINRPLTDDERSLIGHLAAAVLSQQTGSTIEVAADVLGQFADEGKMMLRGDAYDAYLEVNGKVLVHVTREFLAFFAANPNEVIDLDRYCTTYPPEAGQ